MNVLFLTPVTPAIGGNGLAMRAGLFLEGLSRSFTVRVLVVPVFGSPSPPGPLVNRCATSFDVVPLDPSPDQVADLVARLSSRVHREHAQALHPRPALCRSATLAAAHHIAAAARGTDVVHVFRLYLAPFLDSLLGRADRPPVVLDVDELDGPTLRSLGEVREAERFDRLEAHYLPLFDYVLASSDAEIAALSDGNSTANALAVPNAVRSPDAGADSPGSYDLLFVANLSYPPNADGARWLCDQVLPELRGVSVALVGCRPPPAVLSLGNRTGIVVVPDVADVTPWYLASSVAVVPVRVGGGTRTKLLEALIHRRPVVATGNGAHGLGVGREQGVLIADTPGDFAAACQQLLDDRDLARSLGSRGYASVSGTATVDVVAPRIDQLFRSIVGL